MWYRSWLFLIFKKRFVSCTSQLGWLAALSPWFGLTLCHLSRLDVTVMHLRNFRYCLDPKWLSYTFTTSDTVSLTETPYKLIASDRIRRTLFQSTRFEGVPTLNLTTFYSFSFLYYLPNFNYYYFYYYKWSTVQGLERVIYKPYSPKTPAPTMPTYIDRKKRKGKRVEDIVGIEQLRSMKKHWRCSWNLPVPHRRILILLQIH